MFSPKGHFRSIALFLTLSFSLLLAAQAFPQGAPSGMKKPQAAAGVSAPGFMERADPGGRAAGKHSRLLPSLLGLAVAGTVVAVLVLTVFKKSGGYNPHIIPQDFVAGFSNPYFPHQVGQVLNYAVSEGGSSSVMSVTSTPNTKMIMGVLCLGVHDQGRGITFVGQTEDTWHWYAQDRDGNVWYFSRETKKYDYEVMTENWSWQAGDKGAKPGMAMVGRPQDYLNKEFQLDYVPGLSMTRALVVSVNETVTVPCGTFSGCIKIKFHSELETGKEAYEYFAPGVGLVLSESLPAGSRRQELVSIGGE
jgi:hypothetical protein